MNSNGNDDTLLGQKRQCPDGLQLLASSSKRLLAGNIISILPPMPLEEQRKSMTLGIPGGVIGTAETDWHHSPDDPEHMCNQRKIYSLIHMAVASGQEGLDKVLHDCIVPEAIHCCSFLKGPRNGDPSSGAVVPYQDSNVAWLKSLRSWAGPCKNEIRWTSHLRVAVVYEGDMPQCTLDILARWNSRNLFKVPVCDGMVAEIHSFLVVDATAVPPAYAKRVLEMHGATDHNEYVGRKKKVAVFTHGMTISFGEDMGYASEEYASEDDWFGEDVGSSSEED